jgi:hypothetical protein
MRASREGAKNARTMVMPSERDGAEQERQQECGAAHSTGESGELTREDPIEGRSSRVTESTEGKAWRLRALKTSQQNNVA